VHRSVDYGPAVQKQRRAGRGHLGRGQPRLTFETLQAAYSQPTFRNPFVGSQDLQKITPTHLAEEHQLMSHCVHSTGRLNGSSQQAEMVRLGPRRLR
jgi:hypothetical protein